MKKKKTNKKIITPIAVVKEEVKEIVIPEVKVEEPPKPEKKIVNAVSVIIPVKDRTDSTRKLLDELYYQKKYYYPETEIIVVENGSTEDMSFLDNYEGMIIVHEPVDGVSHARNVGLDLAHGRFISFIDNDDFIDRGYLHNLYKTMRTTDCDWARILCKVDDTPYYDNETFDMNNPVKTCTSVVCYCYNERIIGDKRFNEHLNVGEDKEWLDRVIQPDTKGEKCPIITYFIKWAGNEDSLSHKYNRGEISKER